MSGSGPRPRPESARVAPISDRDDLSPEAAEVMAAAIGPADGPTLNIFGTLAHHPKLFKRFNLFGGFLLNKGLVPAREREIVILRVGWNAKSKYEFGQHMVIGERAGLTEAEVTALGSADIGDTWSDDDRALIALADELCADDCVTDETYAALGARWSDAELIELVVCAGFYRLVSGTLNTFGVELDPGVPSAPWLENTEI